MAPCSGSGAGASSGEETERSIGGIPRRRGIGRATRRNANRTRAGTTSGMVSTGTKQRPPAWNLRSRSTRASRDCAYASNPARDVSVGRVVTGVQHYLKEVWPHYVLYVPERARGCVPLV